MEGPSRGIEQCYKHTLYGRLLRLTWLSIGQRDAVVAHDAI